MITISSTVKVFDKRVKIKHTASLGITVGILHMFTTFKLIVRDVFTTYFT